MSVCRYKSDEFMSGLRHLVLNIFALIWCVDRNILHSCGLAKHLRTVACLVQWLGWKKGKPTAMSEFILLLLSTALVNNVVLIKFLGLCPVMGVSKSVDSALGMGLATTFVITLAAGASWMLDNWLLTPFGMGYLRILTYILVIAAVVQFTEMFIKKASPGLYQSLGIYLPLITTNCAVLGVALLNVEQKFSLFKSLLYGFGSALGFTIVLLIFAGLRERIALARVPGAFAGAPISFITISLLALAFMGFSGLSV